MTTGGETTLLTTGDEARGWLFDDGLLDDTMLEAATLEDDRVVLRLAFAEPQDPPPGTPRGDHRWSYRRKEAPIQPIVLTGRGQPALDLAGATLPGGIDGYDVADAAEGFEILIQVGTAVLTARAGSFEVVLEETELRPVERVADPDEVRFRGELRLTAEQLVGALAERRHEVELYSNWRGSEQRFGAALLRNDEPVRLEGDAVLRTCCVAPAGRFDPERPDARLWHRNSQLRMTYQGAVRCTSAELRPMFLALVDALASLEGIQYAISGDVLFEEMGELRRWLGELG